MSLKISKNVKLAEYTSWLIGGEAEYFVLPANIEELRKALKFAAEMNLPITILGGGSNVLISDQGVRGLVICLRRFAAVKTEILEVQSNIGSVNSNLEKKFFIECLAGTAKSELLKIFLKNQLEPALFLAGLPGDVGGGVVMNAGVAEAFVPREFMDFVDWIEVMDFDGGVKRILKSDLKIRYRHTDGWQPHIVVNVGISWPMKPKSEILQLVRDANRVRLSKQPLDKPSCGSVFKNPDGHKAAQLIDQCGLKGFSIGGAQVSLKHANFIINAGNALAWDVWAVIQHVQKEVYEQKGVQLTTEVVRLGIWD